MCLFVSVPSVDVWGVPQNYVNSSDEDSDDNSDESESDERTSSVLQQQTTATAEPSKPMNVHDFLPFEDEPDL